jgi:DNA ligase-4
VFGIFICDGVFRYFFHATSSRIDSEEYDDGDDEDDTKMEDAEAGPSTSKTEHDEDVIQPKAEEVDPALADWFKVEEDEKKFIPGGIDDDSETENDSDNADVTKEEPDDDLDDWLKVKPASKPIESHEDQPDVSFILFGKVFPPTFLQEEAVEDTKMGEDEDAMEYDQDLIFKHLFVVPFSPINLT